MHLHCDASQSFSTLPREICIGTTRSVLLVRNAMYPRRNSLEIMGFVSSYALLIEINGGKIRCGTVSYAVLLHVSAYVRYRIVYYNGIVVFHLRVQLSICERV